MEEQFDEYRYLQERPDVAEAVRAGQFTSGRHHYDLFGRTEASPSLPEPEVPASSPADPFGRFEHRRPSPQTAVDVFQGRWASDLGPVLGVTGTGSTPLFERDGRPFLAAKVLGASERLDGMDVLELGPLEGGHTFQLEQLGARSVTAVEASVEAYLKCLVVKETLGLRARFLLGDVLEHLAGVAAESRRFEMVFCSGILYHMADPLALIRAIAEITDRCFVWTHYFDPENHRLEHSGREHTVGGYKATYWSHVYGDKTTAFWGGNRPSAAWLEREALLDAFQHFGFGEITVLQDDKLYVNGPNIMFCASKGSPRGERIPA